MPEPPQFIRRELVAHRKRVLDVSWNCSGRKLGTASDDHNVRVWPVDPSGMVKLDHMEIELKGHTESVFCLRWHPKQENTLASMGDRGVKLWDIRQPKGHYTINIPGGLALAWHPTGDALAVATRGDSVVFFDARRLKPLKSYKATMEVNDVAYLPSGSHVMVTTGAGTVDVLQVPCYTRTASMAGHVGQCYCAAVSSDAKHMASGGGDALVALWELSTGVCTRTWHTMDNPVRSVSFSPDGSLLAFAMVASHSTPGSADVVDVASGALVHSTPVQIGCESVAWNPKHPVLAFTGEEPREGGTIGLLVPKPR